MVINALVGGPLETFGYLVYDREGGSGLIVDAPFGSTRRFLGMIVARRVQLMYIVNTHGHWDHTADNVALVEATQATLCAHSWDATRLANPTLATEEEPAIPVLPSKAERNLQDGDMVELGEYNFQVIHTPGHTPGSICLYAETSRVLFTGDTLFRMGVGQTKYPGGNAQQLEQSLKRLAQLPDNTKVYPGHDLGHGLSTTIGDERWLLEL